MRMSRYACFLSGLILSLSALAGCASTPPRYLMGAYRFDDGRLVSIRADENKDLRYREFASGESRRLYRHRRLRYVSGAGFSVRNPVRLTVDFRVGEDGRANKLIWNAEGHPPESADRIGIEEWVTFAGRDTSLFGRLDLPASPGPHPAIVLVHDSDRSAATDCFYAGDFFAPNGIATLTFDKRGTGRSEGEHSFSFKELAEDVVAAAQYLKSRPDIDSSRIGLSAYGQGGWVAPLAASMMDGVAYIMVNCGVIESPADEAVLETRNLMRKRGVDEASLNEIDKLTAAAIKVIASNFKEWDEFDEIKNEHNDAEWREKLKGTTVDDLLKYPHFIVKLIGPLKTPSRLDWYYDSVEALQGLNVPIVWLLAEKDESSPNDLTIPKLRKMIAEGKPHELIVFPDAGHSMLVFAEEGGERVYTGYAGDYFTIQVQCARRLAGIVEEAH